MTLAQIKTLCRVTRYSAQWAGAGQLAVNLANVGLTLADLGVPREVEDHGTAWDLPGIGTLVRRGGTITLEEGTQT